MIPVVCLVKNERPIDESTFRFLLQFVQPEKRERILRQRIKQNADNMLVGDILAKYMVKREFGIPFSCQQISYGQYGKPYLTRYPDVHFNISHSGRFVVCAVCSFPVGIDVQEIVSYNPDVARRVCSEKEMDYIEHTENTSFAFTEIWTRKEAISKLSGHGIYGMIAETPPEYSSVLSWSVEHGYLSVVW